MPDSLSHVRQGFGTVRAYLHGPVGLPEFVRTVFGAVELERHAFGPQKFHVELQLGDSVLVIEAGELPPSADPWRGAVCVYVPDVDAVHARALANGAVSIAAPVDKPYGERQCGFTDSGGNTWWVSTLLPASGAR